jgi:hypothetical protein
LRRAVDENHGTCKFFGLLGLHYKPIRLWNFTAARTGALPRAVATTL